MHIASSFALIEDDCEFTKDIEPGTFKKIRSTMISAVLSTDMSRHFTSLGMFKSKLAP